MRFLTKPNLPEAKVTLCVISSGFPEIKESLAKRGIEVIEAEPLEILQKPVRSHADMLLHDLGKGRVITAKGADNLKAELEAYGFEVSVQELGGEYPDDIALNCFCLANKLFCKKDSTSGILLKYYQYIGAEAVNVKQGYAKCSTAIVDERSIITADARIAQAAQNCGLNVLRIHSGGILLPGCDTGFMGGCCGLISPMELAFTGKLSNHIDSDIIKAFCAARGIDIIELTDSALTDIGGILPLAI